MVGIRAERRLFRVGVLIASLVPILAGAAGALQGAAMIKGVDSAGPDLDSHFRYLSGLLLGVGIGFVFCTFDLQRRSPLFNALGVIVIAGGLARLLGVALGGLPAAAHLFALLMELLVVPGLLLWLRRIVQFARQHPRG